MISQENEEKKKEWLYPFLLGPIFRFICLGKAKWRMIRMSWIIPSFSKQTFTRYGSTIYDSINEIYHHLCVKFINILLRCEINGHVVVKQEKKNRKKKIDTIHIVSLNLWIPMFLWFYEFYFSTRKNMFTQCVFAASLLVLWNEKGNGEVIAKKYTTN